MRSKSLGTALATLVLALPPLLPDAASAGALETEYSVTVRGFPVGHARLQAAFDDGRYTITFSGGITGLAQLFSDAETSAAAVGVIGADRLQPDEYKHLWKEDNETEAVDMHFAGRRLANVALDPPRTHPERYAPLTEANTTDVLDPVSAFLWPIAGSLGPDICARTLPLIDGKRRFDIALHFDRVERFATRDSSFHDRTVVCRFSYEKIAGHRIDKVDDTLFDGDGMEVWMAPVGAGLVVPARIQVQTRIGRVVLVATSLRTE